MSDTNLVQARESSRQLSTLLRHEHGAMADFLVALADFDRRGLWRDLGHSCLFHYLQRELRLSDGAAHFRKVAARLIQGFPEVVEPPTANDSRIHMTVSSHFLEKLEAARRGQGHVQPGATKEQVIEAALDLLLAKQASRRAEVTHPQGNPRPSKAGHVTAAVKRAVWARDEGKCQWPVDGGGVCGSTMMLEIDHVVPRGKGGPSTVANCRLTCKGHDLEAARQVYGDAHMDLFTRSPPVAWEPVAIYGPPPFGGNRASYPS